MARRDQNRGEACVVLRVPQDVRALHMYHSTLLIGFNFQPLSAGALRLAFARQCPGCDGNAKGASSTSNACSDLAQSKAQSKQRMQNDNVNIPSHANAQAGRCTARRACDAHLYLHDGLSPSAVNLRSLPA